METTLILNAPHSPDHAAVWLSEALATARDLRATDVHFFPAADQCRLWFRIDGVLHEVCRYAPLIHERLMARLKVMARCPDYVREAVAEGRLTVGTRSGGGDRLEARLSIIPALAGEKAVVRLLAPGNNLPRLATLGFSAALLATLTAAVAHPQGLLLATGPAGSGKSTTLAALLAHVNETSTSPLAIMTLEDPPEIPLHFATQVAVQPQRELGFAQGLRAMLRQDPELILVGEIRDPETAQTALSAALTGHRLLSSLHTATGAEALVRLQEMGVAPYVLASAVGGVLSQRLVRRPCAGCSRRAGAEASIRDGALAILMDAPGLESIPEPEGCDACHELGYRGRIAVGEFVRPGIATAEALARRVSTPELIPTLERPHCFLDEARQALHDGLSTPAELVRVLGQEFLRTGGHHG